MITGVHALLYAKEHDAIRAFFRDVLEFDSIDVGGGWLIFALPPAELAVHPTEGAQHPEVYLICDDLEQTIAMLSSKNVKTSKVTEESWGKRTTIHLAGGFDLGLYQPYHPTAFRA